LAWTAILPFVSLVDDVVPVPERRSPPFYFSQVFGVQYPETHCRFAANHLYPAQISELKAGRLKRTPKGHARQIFRALYK
jgi:hypothetical protein